MEHGNTLGELFHNNDSSKPVDHVDTPWKWESLHIMPETVRHNADNTNVNVHRRVITNANTTRVDVCTKYDTVNVEAGGTFSKATEILDEDRHLVEMEQIKNDIVHIFCDSKESSQPFMAASKLSWLI